MGIAEKLFPGAGTGGSGPMRRKHRQPGQNSDVGDWARGWCTRQRGEHFQDFHFKAAATEPLPWKKAVVGTTPTGDFLANAADGIYKLLLTSTDEVQTARLDWADQLLIPASCGWIFQAKLAKSAITTAQRVVFGMATAYNATLDSVAENAWFRFEASNVLRFETDDNTTDSALTAGNPSVTNVASAYDLYTIDGRDINNIGFYIGDNKLGSLAAGALTAAMLLQPLVVIQKDSGTGVPFILLDYVRLEWNRSN